MKGKILVLICVCVLLFVAACGTTQSGPVHFGGDQQENGTEHDEQSPQRQEETEKFKIKLNTIYNGGELSTVPAELRVYLNEQTESGQLKFLADNKDSRLYRNGVQFSWEPSENTTSYTVRFADNPEFKKKMTFCTGETSLSDSARFVPGRTYYWKVVSDQTGDCSTVDSFVYSSEPVRIIDAEGADNVRDLGGWKTQDGKTVQFGKLFRGARINQLTKSGIRTLSEDLGIQTELDLRNEHDDGGQNGCVFGADKNYLKVSLNQYCYILPEFRQTTPVRRQYDATTPSDLKTIFSCLADESNYPIYFHCNAGADRTGTLAFLLNGLLGVSYEDLVKDFELTSFSGYGQRWRGEISDNYRQTSDVMRDDSGNYVAFDKMYKMMVQGYAAADGSLSGAIANYLQSVCGVTESEIKTIRNIMLTK